MNVIRPTKSFLIVLTGLLLPAWSSAAVVETRGKDWGNGGNMLCCEAVFEARYGDNAATPANGEWEISGDDGTNPSQDIQYQYTSTGSSATMAFSLTHSADSGDLTFTIGGLAPIVLDMPGPDAAAPNGYGWGTIGLLVASNGAQHFQTSLSNLTLTSNATGAVNLADLITGSKGDKVQTILLNEDEYGFFYDFTMTGDVTLAWDPSANVSKIKPDALQFMIGVQDQVPVPVPAALWLMFSALGLLVGRARMRQPVSV